MRPAPEGVLPDGAAPPAPPGQVWDEWPPSTSPLLTEVSAREDGRWSLAGRRALVTGAGKSGVGEIRVHPWRIVEGARLEVDGRVPEAVSLWVAPDEIVRVLQAGEVQLTERISTALDQGLIFWSLLADAPVAIRITWLTDFQLATSPAPPASPRFPTLAAQNEAGASGYLRVGLDNAPPRFQAQALAGSILPPERVTLPAGPAFRFEVRSDRLVRLILAAGGDEAELERTLDALRRRKLRAFRQDRILHARRIEERLVALESSDPALDRAFGWAKVRLDGSLVEVSGLGRTLAGEAPERAAVATLAMGDRDIAKDVIRHLARGDSGEGSAIALLDLVERYARWSGDLVFLERLWPGLEALCRLTALPPMLARRLGAVARALGREERPCELDGQVGSAGASVAVADGELTGWQAVAGDHEDPARLVLRVIEGLWAVQPDALRGEVRVEPTLPKRWSEMCLKRLRVGPTTLDIRVRRRPESTVIMVRRGAGPAIRLRLSLRSRPGQGPVTVDQAQLGGDEVAFMLEDVHEVVYHD